MNSSDTNAESSSQVATSSTIETSTPSPNPLNDLEQNLVKLDINQENNSEDDEKTYIKNRFVKFNSLNFTVSV